MLTRSAEKQTGGRRCARPFTHIACVVLQQPWQGLAEDYGGQGVVLNRQGTGLRYSLHLCDTLVLQIMTRTKWGSSCDSEQLIKTKEGSTAWAFTCLVGPHNEYLTYPPFTLSSPGYHHSWTPDNCSSWVAVTSAPPSKSTSRTCYPL